MAPPKTNAITAIMNISTGFIKTPPHIKKVENSNKEFPTLETKFSWNQINYGIHIIIKGGSQNISFPPQKHRLHSWIQIKICPTE